MQFKDHKASWNKLDQWKKIAAGSAATLLFFSTITTGVLAFDERYSKVATNKTLKELRVMQIAQHKDYTEKILKNSAQIKKGLNNIIRRNLEDKIFQLEFKEAQGTRTDLEKALLPKYKRELGLLNQ